jgi:hypothetical protein
MHHLLNSDLLLQEPADRPARKRRSKKETAIKLTEEDQEGEVKVKKGKKKVEKAVPIAEPEEDVTEESTGEMPLQWRNCSSSFVALFSPFF